MNYVPPRRSDGTVQRTRIREPWPAGRPFRILSIDGGGIRGILPAAVLANIETRFLDGRSVAAHFDMVAGTSTGGIIALGLAQGLSAREVLEFYVKRGGNMFPQTKSRLGGLARWGRRLTRTAYDSKLLEADRETLQKGSGRSECLRFERNPSSDGERSQIGSH